ncbi:hypothetical protein EDD11_000619 [Mortierella claussenii]|nr:hypothetical protein EDD11_000619 [Mortierella claussenii]
MFSSGFGSGGFGGQQQQQQQNTGFGSGQNAFGSTGSFGAPATGFGAAANTGFGGAAQNTGFGGAPATNAFGAAPATPGFGGGKCAFGGSTTGFGVQAQTQPQNGFGGSTFGGTNTSTTGGGFGGFGSNATTTSGFGSGSGFGGKPATTGFGAQPSTGFGSSAAIGFGAGASSFGGGGILGGGMSASGGNGTINPAFSAFVEKEPATGQNSHYQSITAMPAYRGYSFEELRLQDYQQGRKFPGQASGFGGAATGFGQQQQQQPAAGGFGSQPATGFGAANTTSTLGGFGSGSTGFGGATTSGFGSTPGFGSATPGSTGFGAQAAAPTTGFGAASTAFGAQPSTGFGTATGTGFGTAGGFGAAAATKPTTGFGAFGATATSQPASGFGATTGGFGASSAAPSLFGNTAAGTPGAFGAPAASTSTGFGGFGAAQTSAAPAATGLGFGLGGATGGFGAPKPATSSLFGGTATSTAAAPSFGAFGSTPASGTGGLFGGTSTGSSLFPTASSASTGLFGGAGATAAPAFGTSTTSTGLFGASKPASSGGLFAQAPSTGFGAAPTFGTAGATQTSSLFGGAGTTGGGFGASSFGSGFLGGSTNTAAAQPSMVASVNGNIYGDNPLFQRDTTTAATKSQPAVLSRSEPTQKLPALIPPVRFSPRHTQIRLRPTSTATFSSSVTGGDLPAGRKSLLLLEGINDDSAFSSDDYAPRRSVKKLQLKPRGQGNDQATIQPNQSSRAGVTFNPSLESAAAESLFKSQPGMDRSTLTNGKSLGSQLQANAGRNEPSLSTPPALDTRVEGEYWMTPSLEELRKMSRSELQRIKDFKVGLPGCGSVSFLEPVDLSTVPSLSSICGHIVVFQPRICIVYPDEHNKPARGQGMNVPALISLEKCWPMDKSTREPVKFEKSSPQYTQFLKRLKRQSETTFIDFNTEDGTWTFRVEHFSQYGLTDDEYDINMVHGTDDHHPFPVAASKNQRYRSERSNEAPRQYGQLITSAFVGSEVTRNTARLSKNRDPQRLNSMRASLFTDTVLNQDRLSKRSSVWSTSSENVEHSNALEEHAGGFEAETRPSFQQEYDSKQSLVMRPPRKFTRSQYEHSLLTRKGSLLADAGLMMGRSCRVGWGPNGTFAMSGTLTGFNDIKERAGKREPQLALSEFESPSSVRLLKVKVVADSENEEILRHIISMQALIHSTSITLDQNNEPKAAINPGTSFTTLMSRLKELQHNLSEEEVYAWMLGQSLFDPQPKPSNMADMPVSVQESYESLGRRTRCSNWLSYVTKSALEADMRAIEGKDSPSAHEDAIFTLLASNKHQKASVAAVQSRNLRLATLISQSGRGSQPLLGLENQMKMYKELGQEGNVPVSYLKVYALLSGALDINIAPKGEPQVFVTDGMDWRRTFGLYLWHSSSPGADLPHALNQYSASMSTRKNIARPRPWYQREVREDELEHFDFLFQLIALLALPSKALEDALHPLGMSPACLDYRQSWLFYMILDQSLQVGRFRSDMSHAKLCQNFIFQLESLGLWEWAVFVALHLETAASREMAVRQILERYVDLPAPVLTTDEHMSSTVEPGRWEFEGERNSFLLNELRIPRAWLWSARATRAKYQGELYMEVFSLLKGGEYERGHILILSRLAPACILQGDLKTLGKLLSMVDQNKVTSWEVGGAIYQQYLECCSDFLGNDDPLEVKTKVSYANDLVPPEDVLALKDELQLLLARLPLLEAHRKDESPSLSVCVAEMSTKCTTLLWGLQDMSLQESASLATLPLLEDERMSTVQKISVDYFDDILNTAETSAY